MPSTTQAGVCPLNCTARVPPELAVENLCVLHFTLNVEQACAAGRRELARARPSQERQVEIESFVLSCGLTLARVATGSGTLSDELKRRVLSTFLTLMVFKESLERRAPSGAEPQLVSSLHIPRLSQIA
jgi:methylphosphotriester-DNA--protein-cysteine methyltransferase